MKAPEDCQYSVDMFFGLLILRRAPLPTLALGGDKSCHQMQCSAFNNSQAF
jgi:hypothetical protein